MGQNFRGVRVRVIGPFTSRRELILFEIIYVDEKKKSITIDFSQLAYTQGFAIQDPGPMPRRQVSGTDDDFIGSPRFKIYQPTEQYFAYWIGACSQYSPEG